MPILIRTDTKYPALVLVLVGVVALAALGRLGVEETRAEAVCSDTPGAGQWVKCTENADSTKDIIINLEGVNIAPDGDRDHGVEGSHKGKGNISITVRGTADSNSISMSGRGKDGIHAAGQGEGSIDIDVDDVTIITTGDGYAMGVSATQSFITFRKDNRSFDGAYHVKVDVDESSITTSGQVGYGVRARLDGPNAEVITGEVEAKVINTDITTGGQSATGIESVISTNVQGDNTVTVTGGTVTTSGGNAKGIFASSTGSVGTSGDVLVRVTGATIETEYDGSNDGSTPLPDPDSYTIRAVNGLHTGDAKVSLMMNSYVTQNAPKLPAISLLRTNSQAVENPRGNAIVNIQGGEILTRGFNSHGVHARLTDRRLKGDGDIGIDLRNVMVKTEGTGSYGVYGYHESDGDIRIDAHSGTVVSTMGAEAHALRAWHVEGDVFVTLRQGSSVTTTGEMAHGMDLDAQGAFDFQRAQASLDPDTREITVRVDGAIEVKGAGAQGIRIGIGQAGLADRVLAKTAGVASLDDEGIRRHTVTINGRVESNGAGVYLSNGGRVIIGPSGIIRSTTGIAILATGTIQEDASDPANVIPAIPPKLRVDLNLGGRRVWDAIGNDWIINDEGETTIAVNNVVLHDGATGATDNTARNGAWNVRMRAEGVNVRDYTTDPWDITEPDVATVADRDFSVKDFNETRRPPPPRQFQRTPSPPPSPQPQPPPSPEPPPSPGPEPPTGPFHEEYAPRTALYELAPDFLLRLTSPGPTRTCRAAPDKPVWVRFAGGRGAYQAERSTVGATYEFDRFETEGGLRAAFGPRAAGWVSVRHVRGTAAGTAPSGRGEIDARGLGSTVGGRWRGANDVYARGCFSYMGYKVDFASTGAGLLRSGVDARAYGLDVEVGRRLAVSERLDVTPRLWVVGSRVSLDRFTDTVNAAVSVADADRVLGGVGVVTETTRPWGDGTVALRGSVDYERMFSGAETTASVSGERLTAEATKNSLLVGVRGGYQQGRFAVGAELAARQELGSPDTEYVGFLNLGLAF